jgi:4-amino-4-deoxy-L-arabinose transferase-like glycosyltransferase
MPLRRVLILVVLVWAAIYLPRLGALEIKSEEGRRILPAVTMLETGNFLVPQIGGQPYFSKPPLVNWLVAASFKIFGRQNEWTARLPSTLCVLIVALAFATIARRNLGPNGSAAAAFLWLTNFGLLEKGRMIEIEALYVSLTALAFICWLSWWNEPRRRWLASTVPWIFLGLGLLAKGPLNLLFFYAVVVAILGQARALKQLLSWPHLVGLLIMLGIFAAWAIPVLELMRHAHIATIWSRQFSGRIEGENFQFHSWLLNIPRALAYLLPWLALLPFARFRLLENDADKKTCCALSLGIAIPFFFVNLTPGALPRYSMPLLAPAIWLLAILIREHAFVWPRALRKVITTAVALVAVAMLIYSVAIIPILQRREKIRPIAAQLDAAIPPDESLYAVDPDYQPAFFYLRRPLIYENRPAALPANARYILVRPPDESAVENSSLWQPRRARPILRITDYRDSRVVLLRVD